MSDKITIACPGCSKHLKVPTSMAGKAAKCPGCQTAFRVGGGQPAVPQPQAPTSQFSNQLPSQQNAPAGSPFGAPASPFGNDAYGNNLGSPGMQGAEEPIQAQETFQSQLARQPGRPKNRQLTRREKMQRGRNRAAHEAESEMAWQTAGWGVLLIILSFVSVPIALASEGQRVKGRGIIGLIVVTFAFLGPFGPVLGLLLGLGGVGLVVSSAKSIPKPITLGIGGFVSMIIILACGGTLLHTFGVFGSRTNQSRIAQAQDANQPAFGNQPFPANPSNRNNFDAEEFHRKNMAEAEAFHKKSMAEAEARRKEFFGNQGNDPNPFGGGRSNADSNNPFASGSNRGNPSNPFANGSSKNNSNPFGGGNKKESPFAGGSKEGSNPFGKNNGSNTGSQEASSNPFGGGSKDNTSNPFGGASGGTKSPSDSNNPFAGGNEKKSGNPFGGGNKNTGSENPFGGGSEKSDSGNPFGGGSKKAESGNPFGGGSKKAESDNPFGGGSSNEASPFAGGTNKPESENPFGGGNSAANDNPFAGGGEKKSENPFATGGGQTASEDNPFSGGGAKNDNPFANESGKNASNDNPFANGNSANQNPFGAGGGSTTPSFGSSSFGSETEKRVTLKRRENEAVQLVLVKTDGFIKSKTELEFGKKAGRETLVGQVHYTDSPMTGIIYWRDVTTHFLPSKPGDSDSIVSAAGAGHAVYGFNLNFSLGKLRGVQAIYGPLSEGKINPSQIRTGDWLGKPPETVKPKSINGGGKPVHGFLLFKDRDEVSGVQLVIQK